MGNCAAGPFLHTKTGIIYEETLKLCGNIMKRNLDACALQKNALHYSISKYPYLINSRIWENRDRDLGGNGKHELEKEQIISRTAARRGCTGA